MPLKISQTEMFPRRPDTGLYLGLVLLLHVASFYLESTSDAILFTWFLFTLWAHA